MVRVPSKTPSVLPFLLAVYRNSATARFAEEEESRFRLELKPSSPTLLPEGEGKFALWGVWGDCPPWCRAFLTLYAVLCLLFVFVLKSSLDMTRCTNS
jgi:hypothetical protein